MITNRAAIEKLVYDTFDALDPSGTNGNKYRELYQDMNDKQFEQHMKEFLNNDQENFILDIDEYNRNVTMQHCEAAAKVIGIPLTEYVYLPHLTMDKKNVVVSKERCLVGWINVKRTQQLLHKKNSLSTGSSHVNPLTGQVVGVDKNARSSDIEATMLVSLGAQDILREFHGPRSDDTTMNREMMEDISTNGYVRLDDLTSNRANKVTLNTVATFLLAMQIHSDLVSDSYIVNPDLLNQL